MLKFSSYVLVLATKSPSDFLILLQIICVLIIGSSVGAQKLYK